MLFSKVKSSRTRRILCRVSGLVLLLLLLLLLFLLLLLLFDGEWSVLEAVGFYAASIASASALPLPIAVILLVAIPPTKLEAPYRFQNCAATYNVDTSK